MENNGLTTFGNYAYTDLQLRELFENIERGDIDYSRDLLKVFKNLNDFEKSTNYTKAPSAGK